MRIISSILLLSIGYYMGHTGHIPGVNTLLNGPPIVMDNKGIKFLNIPLVTIEENEITILGIFKKINS